MTEITQESSLYIKEFKCNIINNEEDRYDNNTVLIQIQVPIRMSNNVRMNEVNLS